MSYVCVGPVGAYLKLAPDPPPRVVRILESVIGRQDMEAFICDNSQDRRELARCMDQLRLVKRPKVNHT